MAGLPRPAARGRRQAGWVRRRGTGTSWPAAPRGVRRRPRPWPPHADPGLSGAVPGVRPSEAGAFRSRGGHASICKIMNT